MWGTKILQRVENLFLSLSALSLERTENSTRVSLNVHRMDQWIHEKWYPLLRYRPGSQIQEGPFGSKLFDKIFDLVIVRCALRSCPLIK